MNPIKHGSVDQSTSLRFIDSITGEPEIAVDHATTGLGVWYRREGGLKITISPQALAALDEAHTDGGMEQIGDGYVRLDPPDAAFLTGAAYVEFGGAATGMVVIGSKHPLVANVEADTIARLPAALVSGRMDSSVGAMAAAVVTAAAIASDAITDAKVAADVTIASVTGAVGSVSGNVDGNVVGTVGSLAAQAKTDVNVQAAAALTSFGPPTLAEMDASFAALTDVTANEVVTAILAATADGSLTVHDAFKDIIAYVRGAIAKSTNDYAYKNQAGATRFTNQKSASARTPV